MKYATPSIPIAPVGRAPGTAIPIHSAQQARAPKADPALDLVRFALAQHLGIEVGEIEEEQLLDEELGLDPLDLVLIVLRLEELGEVEFPVADLERVLTVRDLTAMVRSWWRRSCEATLTLPPPAPPAPRSSESGIHLRAGLLPLLLSSTRVS